MKKYWIPALFYSNENQSHIIEGEVGTDGLLIRLPLDGANSLLRKFVPDEDGNSWYFNQTKDRVIAEITGDSLIVANPQLIWQNDFSIVS